MKAYPIIVTILLIILLFVHWLM